MQITMNFTADLTHSQFCRGNPGWTDRVTADGVNALRPLVLRRLPRDGEFGGAAPRRHLEAGPVHDLLPTGLSDEPARSPLVTSSIGVAGDKRDSGFTSSTYEKDEEDAACLT